MHCNDFLNTAIELMIMLFDIRILCFFNDALCDEAKSTIGM